MVNSLLNSRTMNVRPAAASAPKKRALAYGALLLLAAGAATVVVLGKISSYPAASHVNPAAPVQTRQTTRINAPVEKVWRLMSQISQWAAWNSDISAAQLNGPLQPGTSFDWEAGGITIHSPLHTVEPRAALGWSGTAFGSFAVHNWSFTPEPEPEPDGSTEVRVEEGMAGWLVSLLQPIFQRGLDDSSAQWLTCLQQAAERP